MAERRQLARVRKRLGCEIRARNHRHFGMVLNLSAEGLFIETSANIAPGTPVGLSLAVEHERIRFELQGRVARLVRTPASPARVARSGLGVKLEEPPASYRAFVAKLLGGSPAPLPEAQPIAEDGSFDFRVELQALGGAERRTLLVSCKSEAEATELAAAELDSDWKVLTVERL